MIRKSTRLWAAALLAWLTLAAGLAAAAEPPLLDLGASRGKVIVVDFWASWCVPCRRSIPWLNAMQSKYAGKGLVVIGVNVDADRAAAERFLEETPAQFPIVYDPAGRLPKEYGVMGMPSSYLFDRDGQLAGKHIGFQNRKRDEYEQLLRKLLNEGSK